MASTSKPIKIVLTGGGTGGHIYPALAIGKGLKKRVPNVKTIYLGTAHGLEADLVPKEGLEFYPVTAQGLERKISWKAFRAVLATGKGLWQSWRLLRRIRPDVVVGTGGYVCGPVVLAAAKLGIPTVIHEQNAFPGMTNRLLARVADKTCVTFHESEPYFPAGADVVHTGLPVRQEILITLKEQGLQELNLNEKDFHILVVGGSQGARSLNQAMINVYKGLEGIPGLHWLHITGKNGYEEVKEGLQESGIDVDKIGNITIEPYIYAMENALAVADLVVGRAGASFLAEIMARGIPAVLIPYPYASENHQEYNARALENQGAAVVILEKNLSGELLLKILQEVIDNHDKLRDMAVNTKKMGKPEALTRIVDLVLDLINYQ